MESQKQAILLTVAVVVVAALTGGGLWWRHQQAQKKQLASSHQADSGDSSSGLSVLGSASDLGQLGESKSGQEGAGGSGGSSGSSGSGVDPAQFAQYDKYKNETNALFGEIQAGNGAALAAGQKVNMYYKVWLTNGALIDQSPVSASGQRQPYSFTLGSHQVIPGLEQGVAGMKVGGKRLVIVPPAVGYGTSGQGSIPPNAVLIFDIEVLNAQ